MIIGDGSEGFMTHSLWRDRNDSLIILRNIGLGRPFHPSWCRRWISCPWAMKTAPERPFMCRWRTQALPFGQRRYSTVAFWWYGNGKLTLTLSLRLRSHGSMIVWMLKTEKLQVAKRVGTRSFVYIEDHTQGKIFWMEFEMPPETSYPLINILFFIYEIL